MPAQSAASAIQDQRENLPRGAVADLQTGYAFLVDHTHDIGVATDRARFAQPLLVVHL